MRRVFSIGQSVFDILFKENEPFAAKVGGSMLNSSISLGRLGVEVFFLGEFGNDLAGQITKEFLEKNHVNTDFSYQYNDGQTTISLAFLREDNNAEYNFYRNMPQKRLDINFPVVNENDIILFGSFYMFDEAIERKVLPFLLEAKEKGAILIYDPNFRKPHYGQIDSLKPKFLQYFGLADIIRGSDEDFYGIFSAASFDDLTQSYSFTNKVLVYTKAEKGVKLLVNNQKYFYEVPKITPVSTIGAGDTFNAGLIYGLINDSILKNNLLNLKKNTWDSIIERSITFAEQVCLSEDNYLPTNR